MVTIGVYEDTTMRLNDRYDGLLDNHEIELVYCIPSNTDIGRAQMISIIKNHGYDPSRISFDISHIPRADIYFVGPLGSRVEDVMKRLPKEITFLDSRDTDYIAIARRLGCNVVDDTPKGVISRVFG